jgi:putative IMPACT (imprinted ancient) family translation regulator
VETEEEASAHVARIRKQYYDARHHCYAWVLGEGSERKSPRTTASPPERPASLSSR